MYLAGNFLGLLDEMSIEAVTIIFTQAFEVDKRKGNNVGWPI